MKYIQLVILSVVLCTVGCHSTPRTYNKSDVEQYFGNLRLGTKLSKIKRDMKLSEPAEIHTPELTDIGTLFLYRHDGLVIGIKATGRDDKDFSDYVYVGLLYLDTEQEFEEAIENRMPHYYRHW